MGTRRAAALLVIAALVALLGASGPARAAVCSGAEVVPAADTLALAAAATRCLLDEQRAARGLRPTRRNARLERASEAYSRRMVAESFFAHVAPDGARLTERLIGAGYIAASDEYVVGENLAWGQGALSTPRAIVAAWMGSPAHRANVLDAEYAEIGLTVVPGTPSDRAQGATVTAEYGVRAPATSPRRARCASARGARARPARAGSARRACARSARRAAAS